MNAEADAEGISMTEKIKIHDLIFLRGHHKSQLTEKLAHIVIVLFSHQHELSEQTNTFSKQIFIF